MSSVDFVPQALSRGDELRARRQCTIVRHGESHVLRTPALTNDDASWFRERGFRPVQQLVLLDRFLMSSHDCTASAHDTASAIEPTTVRATSWRTLRGRRSTALLAELLKIDAESFSPPWSLTRNAFRHACTLTDDHRVFIHTVDHKQRDVDGFVIAGRSGSQAYLQRLVVRPLARRRGIASLLVDHACTWAQRRGATLMRVNTETNNAGALSLYRSRGFTISQTPLVVLERPIIGGS